MPHVAAHDALMADAGITSQDRRVGVDDHVVFEIRMALVVLAALHLSVVVFDQGVEGSQGYPPP